MSLNTKNGKKYYSAAEKMEVALLDLVGMHIILLHFVSAPLSAHFKECTMDCVECTSNKIVLSEFKKQQTFKIEGP